MLFNTLHLNQINTQGRDASESKLESVKILRTQQTTQSHEIFISILRNLTFFCDTVTPYLLHLRFKQYFPRVCIPLHNFFWE